MTKGLIKFSILVPVYQVERYIDGCIQSVLNQTYTNWELILVDDGSKDKSGEICDRYAEQYSNIYVYHKENRGLMHTRRYGIARATGDYCVFLDSDDTIKQNTLEVIYSIIEKYDCDCVIYGYEKILDGVVIEKSLDEKEICITDKRELYRKCCMGGYGMLVRKAVKMTAFQGKDYSPYYHMQLGEDDLQSLEILSGSNKVVIINNRLYYYRMNPNSITQTMKLKDMEDSLEVYQMILDFLREENVFEKEDYIKYGSTYIVAVCSTIVSIAASKLPFFERVHLMHQMKDRKIYRSIVGEKMYDSAALGKKTKVVLALLEGGHYRTLVAASSAYRLLKKSMKLSV